MIFKGLRALLRSVGLSKKTFEFLLLFHAAKSQFNFFWTSLSSSSCQPGALISNIVFCCPSNSGPFSLFQANPDGRGHLRTGSSACQLASKPCVNSASTRQGLWGEGHLAHNHGQYPVCPMIFKTKAGRDRTARDTLMLAADMDSSRQEKEVEKGAR